MPASSTISGPHRDHRAIAAAIAAAFVQGASFLTTSPALSQQLDQVLVTGTRNESSLLEVPSSASVVDRESLEHRRVSRMGDAIVEVPGLYVRGTALGLGFPGSGQAVLSLRGIPRTPRTLVLLDGLPLNNALSGGVNVAGIAMQNIERVEVVRGPYSALWGGNAMGGVVNFISASADDPIAELRAGLGSHGMRSLTAVARQRLQGGLGLSLSLGHRESDGYDDGDYVVKTLPRARPNQAFAVNGALPTTTVDGAPAWWVGLRGRRPWRQDDANLSLDWKLGSATHVVAGVGWAEYKVGYSRPQSFLTDASGAQIYRGAVDVGGPRFNLAETDFLTSTPSSERDLRLFARMDHRFDDGSLLKVNLGHYAHRFGFGTAATGPAASAGYDFGPGELTQQPNERTDLDVSWRDTLGAATVLTLGFSLNRSRLDRSTSALSNWRDHASVIRVTGTSEGESTNAAVFAQTETIISEKGRLVLGLRYDRFRTNGSVTDATTGFSEEYGTNSFGRLSPKAALSWQLSPAMSVRGSIGAGFRPPALLDLYSRFTVPVGVTPIVFDASPDLKPERVLAIDAGTDLRFANGVRGSLTVYAQQLEDMIYRRSVTPTLRRSENTGEARVDGIEADLRAPAGLAGLNVFGALTHNFRYEVTRNDALPASVGKKLTDVPRTMWSIGADYTAGPWHGLLTYRHVSHVFGSADDMNLNTVEDVYESYDSYGIASLRVQYRFNRQLSASLSIDNLTDERYFVFNRQPGRTFFGEIAYRF